MNLVDAFVKKVISGPYEVDLPLYFQTPVIT